MFYALDPSQKQTYRHSRYTRSLLSPNLFGSFFIDGLQTVTALHLMLYFSSLVQ